MIYDKRKTLVIVTDLEEHKQYAVYLPTNIKVSEFEKEINTIKENLKAENEPYHINAVFKVLWQLVSFDYHTLTNIEKITL